MSECPHCGETANSVEEEMQHMTTVHPHIVIDRLRRAGSFEEADALLVESKRISPNIFNEFRWADLNRINSFISEEEVEEITLRRNKASPWLEIDVWVHMRGTFKFAMWMATGAIHLVQADMSVTDDPITEFPEGLAPDYRGNFFGPES